MINIGNITLPNQVALAPMAGVTDLPFRKLCRNLGAGYVVGEMLASDPVHRHTRKSRLRGVHLAEPEPRAIQIVGWDPAALADAARFNVDQGASVIDINMGCPAKKVCKRYAGSALLADELLVANILERVVAAVTVPVTLKIRTGIEPGRRNGVVIARLAEQSGVQAIAVHGRTRTCKYNGTAEYETIRAICKEVSIPVFANGDITSFEAARSVMMDTGAAGIMIGRGAHGAPWMPGLIAQFLQSGDKPLMPSIAQQRDIVLIHLNELHHFYGAFQGVRIARKHIKWYTQNHPDSALFRAVFNRVETPQLQIGMASDYYNQLMENVEKASVWQKNLTNVRAATVVKNKTSLRIA